MNPDGDHDGVKDGEDADPNNPDRDGDSLPDGADPDPDNADGDLLVNTATVQLDLTSASDTHDSDVVEPARGIDHPGRGALGELEAALERPAEPARRHRAAPSAPRQQARR